MTSSIDEMKVLIVGVERYHDNEKDAKRPGTLQALREIEQRLSHGGWKTRLLTDDANATPRRSGLTQILEGLSWLSQANQSLLIMSGRVRAKRFYPVDYKASFISQSTLAIEDLIGALSTNTGLIFDGSAPAELTQNLPWSIVANTQEDKEDLFSTYGPTVFLHSIVISLNTWPFTRELKVKEFFECYQKSGAPSSAYHNYSSLESVSLLTPSLYQDTQSDTRIPQTSPSALTSSSSVLGSSSSSGSSEGPRGGRFLAQGRFQLLRIIGEGGIGQVFLARDVQLNKYRAVKVLKIPDKLSEEQRIHIRGRMIQSVKAAQELSEYTHHVVQVYEIGIDEETELPFMVMEYLEGITLNRRLYQNPRLTLEQIFEIGLTLCETLAIAHQRSVIHRDLKPENVMLIDRGGSNLFVKLLDFDLVKVNASEVQTQEGQILGTLEYMSPEQLKGHHIDARADVFSLGAILYECFSGVRANAGKNQRQLVRTLLDQGVTPLEEVASHVPKEICSLINRTLSLNPDDRPKDAQELTQRLSPLQHLKPALSMMSFGINPSQIPMNKDISSTLDSPFRSSHDSLPDQANTTKGFQDSFESLPTTADEHNVSHYGPTPIALNDQTPVLIDPKATEHHALPRRILHRIIMVSAMGFGVLYAFYNLGPKQLNTTQTTTVAIQDDQTQQHTSTPKSSQPQLIKKPQTTTHPLRPLDHLALLPTPSPTWSDLKVIPYQDSERGLMWVYQGGRLADRLGRLVYELHFKWRQGDPPLDSWINNEELRRTLLERTPRSSILQREGELLISQALRDELIAQRAIMRQEHTQIADVLKVPRGLIVIKATGKRCSRLKAGDLIESMRWVVKGKRKLGGSCQGSSCLNAHQRSLKAKPSMMRLGLTLKVARVEYQETMWQQRRQSIKCSM